MRQVQHWKISDEITLSGVEMGEGELVLLLHGFPAYHKTWDAHLEPLAHAGYRTVAVDMRGYFKSSKPPGVRSYSQREIVGDLVALVHHLGYRTARVVGHDWGGSIAWSMASWHPDIVSHVAVYNCPHPAALSKHLKTDFDQIRRSWYIFFFQLPWLPEALVRLNPDWFIKVCFLAKRGTFSQADLEDYKLAILQPGVLESSINYYRAALRDSIRPPAYPPITCPARLFWGKRDIALGPQLIATTERHIQGPYQHHLYEKHTHWMVNENPDHTVPLLLELFSSSATSA